MGENEGLMQPPGGVILPNGLLPNTGPVKQGLDSERWLKAEKTTAELIACIQPNSPSEERRNAVADYVQRLIMMCFPCQVFTFGSVPLKTYLPDGDIDLTAFSNIPNLKDTWANQVRDILESEEKNENAEFRVKEVQYIQAEVKLIKCLVENIVVDISFNQLGGLCTLCFLEEVDHLISQNHLFKRSIILIKAWCYYESRVLGAHHGLISTYALETLVLYIFHVFNNSFTGPLEVLYRFLEFFSNFDWDNFCVSLWGPVPIASLPDVTAEPPRKDHGELLLSRLFLDACSSVYAVFPGGQENQGQQFLSKHFNVIDPLRVNNNLGRSVSKGNFFRIRSAFAFGAKRLARLLDCPKENIVYEVNQFFTNSWNRHGSGKRPDAPNTDLLFSRLSTPDSSGGSESLKNGSIAKKVSGNISEWDTENDRTGSNKTPSQHGNDPSLKVYGNLKSSRAFNQAIKDSSPKVHIDKGQRTVKPDFLVNDIPGRFLFARTRSSPELTDGSVGFSPQGRRDKEPEGGKNQITRPETNSKTIKVSEKQDNYGARFLSSYQHDLGSGISGNGPPFISRAQIMEEEEQDLVNMMASNTLHGANGHMHVPMNLATGHFPFPVSPSILASMGYGHRNIGMVSPDMHFIDPSFPHMQFPQGLVPPQVAQYFPGVELNSNAEDRVEPNSEHFAKVEMNSEDRDLGQNQVNVSPEGSLPDNRNNEMLQSDDKGLEFVPSSRASSSVSLSRNRQKFTKENRGLLREVHPLQDNGNECLDDRTTASRVSSPGRSSSLKSRTSSESSWDGSLAKVSRSTKEKRGKKEALTEGKNGSEHCNPPVEDDDVWDMRSTMGAGMAERSSVLQSVGSCHGTTQHIHGYELNQTSGSDSMMHMGPVVLGHGSRQRAMDNSRVVFYPTGPPVPFLTMLPVYNVPPDSGNSETSTSHLSVEKGLDNSESRQHFDSSDKLHHIEELHTDPPRSASFSGSLDDKKPDILNSDFASHYQNLLFGRFCQNPHSHGGPVAYPSPVAVPPVYLQGRVPFDGPGRPLSANINLSSHIMGGYGPRLIPVAPFQSASNRPSPVYHHYVEEISRQHNGTGTFLPNPNLSPRERNPPGPRRGNYNYERNDSFGDVERSWNSPKSRTSGRNHFRGQNEKSNSRVERLNSNDTYKVDSVSSYQAQNTQLGSNSNQTTTATPRMAYSMFALQAMNPNRVSSNGPRGPSSPVMLYPFDHNANVDKDTEQLEFGSFGQVDSSSSNEQRQQDERIRPMRAFDEQRFHGVSAQRSSPDQPSSPGFQGGV